MLRRSTEAGIWRETPSFFQSPHPGRMLGNVVEDGMDKAAENKAKPAVVSQAAKFLILLSLVFVITAATSLYLDLRVIGEKYRTLAAEIGRSLFQALDALRDWNLDHEGIYVQDSADMPANPLLPDSFRSLTTKDGRTLNMINHAQMTRLFSELLAQERGIHLHISSLSPVRPENRADAWERRALALFRKGSKEEYDTIGSGDSGIFRYMAPLRMEQRCLSCHTGSSDSSDAIRGGISISFSYAPFRKAIASESRQNILLHVMFLVVGIGLIVLMGRKLIGSIAALQETLLHVKRLEGFLPICAQCKKIRVRGSDQHNQDSWIAFERYIQERTDAEFTHGLCPQCAKDLYPAYFQSQGR